MKRVAFTLCFSALALIGTMAQNEPYKNPQLSPDERAEDLLGRLTLKEKIGLMQNSSRAVERLGIAPYTGGAKHYMVLPAMDWQRYFLSQWEWRLLSMMKPSSGYIQP